ncbi:MAG: universal stress protein [Haloarculaceae archaeon]
MVFLVQFDGSGAARSALERAVAYGRALNEDVLAVALLATGAEITHRRTWIESGDDFVVESAVHELRRKIDEATDDAELNFEGRPPQSPEGGISTEIHRIANEVEASVLFLAGDGTGALEVDLDGRAAGENFDVHVVREWD